MTWGNVHSSRVRITGEGGFLLLRIQWKEYAKNKEEDGTCFFLEEEEIDDVDSIAESLDGVDSVEVNFFQHHAQKAN